MIQVTNSTKSSGFKSLKSKVSRVNFSSNENKLDTVEINSEKKFKINTSKIALAALVGGVIGVGIALLSKGKEGSKELKQVEKSLIESKEKLAKAEESIAEAKRKSEEKPDNILGIPSEGKDLKEFVKKTDKFGFTPLLNAASIGSKQLVEKFLEHGADVNHEGSQGYTALHYATIHGDKEMVNSLLDKGADINALYDRSFKSETIISHGVDGHSIDLAAEHGHNNLIELFISKGVEVKRANSFAETPLMLAAKKGHLNTVKLLLEKGLDVNAIDIGKRTALYKASRNGNKEVVELLLANKADVTKQNDNGMTPLMHAANKGHDDIVKLLLDAGSDVNLKGDKHEMTPLYWAVGPLSRATKNTIELLVNKGADINVLCASKTPLDEAMLYKSFRSRASKEQELEDLKKITEEYKSFGFDPDESANIAKKVHLSMLASRKEDIKRLEEIVEFLKSKGAKTAEELGVAKS